MATLSKRHVYKNGGASYSMPGVKASVYVGPKMFTGTAPDTIVFDATNLASPDADAALKNELKAEAQAKRNEERAAKKLTRETAKSERQAAREAKKLAAAQFKAEKRAAADQLKADKLAAKEAAKLAQATATESATVPA